MITQKKYNSDFFDDKYFLEGTKSNYTLDFFDWERKKEIYRAMAKELNDQFHPNRVLDIGCALGFHVQGFRDNQVEAYGVDISEWAIKHGKPNCQVIDITEQKLPFEDNFFDLITCFDVLEHIPIQFHDFVFSEIARVCSKTLYISQPFLIMPEQVYGSPPKDDESHISLMPPYYYILEFGERNFQLKEMGGISKAHPWDIRMVFSK